MKKIAIFACLTLLTLISVTACAQGAATESTGQEPAPLTEEAAPPSPEVIITEEIPTLTPEEPSLGPEHLIPPGPSLPSKDKPLMNFNNIKLEPPFAEQSIGYTFPEGIVAIKVMPYTTAVPDSVLVFIPVALIEIGSGPDLGPTPPGLYVLLLDLENQSDKVYGQLMLDGEIYSEFEFLRTLQVINPERNDEYQTPYKEFLELGLVTTNSAAINSEGVCLILNLTYPEQSPAFYRYCSQTGSPLSTRANFQAEYESLVASISKTAEIFGMNNALDYGLIISEMEDISRIELCSTAIIEGKTQGELQQVCGSDITVAPVFENIFKDEFEKAKNQASVDYPFTLASAASLLYYQNEPVGQPFPVTAGVMQVLHPIDTDPVNNYEGDTDIVLPGDYRLDYWFDANNAFYAATISGWRYDGVEVINQQVPAVPATFVNADGTEQTPAQISACRIFGRCVFFQKVCP